MPSERVGGAFPRGDLVLLANRSSQWFHVVAASETTAEDLLPGNTFFHLDPQLLWEESALMNPRWLRRWPEVPRL